jgi:hypothetical protein
MPQVKGKSAPKHGVLPFAAVGGRTGSSGTIGPSPVVSPQYHPSLLESGEAVSASRRRSLP